MNRAIAVVQTQARAHARCYDAIHAADTVDADGDGQAAQVSLAKHQRTFHPLDPTDPDDTAAAAHVDYLWNRWFLNAIVKGNWDADFDGAYTSPGDVQGDPTLVGRADYIGVNYYSDTIISASQGGLRLPAPINAVVIERDMHDGRPITDFGWDIYPEGLGTVLDETSQYGLPMLVTENGLADAPDANRARFILEHLYQLGWAMKRGDPVIGYIHWALVDNFEWADGYCPHFGLFAYDKTTGARRQGQRRNVQFDHRLWPGHDRRRERCGALRTAAQRVLPMTDDTKTRKLPVMAGDEVSPRSSNRPSLVEWTDEESSTRTTDAHIAIVPPSSSLLQRTRAVLTVVSGPSMGRVFGLEPTGEETIIGRGKEAHARIDDAGASRAHARILSSKDGVYTIEDLGSTNGTFVDGNRIERAPLHSGVRIHIGPNVILSFSIVDAQAERVAHQLYESAVRDPVTRAHNRRYLVERLASEFAYARRHRTHLALILFDLDHFKRVNDTHGHLVGDDVLREVSAAMQRLVRAEDVFARFGGEEFVLLVRGIEHVNVSRFAERVRQAVERLEIASEAMVVRVTISLGVASLEELASDQREADGLLRLADERLYKAKTGGRNRVRAA